jgi:hypothetical protein
MPWAFFSGVFQALLPATASGLTPPIALKQDLKRARIDKNHAASARFALTEW